MARDVRLIKRALRTAKCLDRACKCGYWQRATALYQACKRTYSLAVVR